MKIGLHFEDTCNDAPAPVWVELPPPKPLRDMTESDFDEALQVNGAAHSEGGAASTTDSQESPATERDDAAIAKALEQAALIAEAEGKQRIADNIRALKGKPCKS